MVIEETLQLILKKFDGLEIRFDGLEGQFRGLSSEFKGLNGRFDGLTGEFKGLNGRFDDLEGKVDLLAINLLEVNEKVDRCATKDELHAVRDELFVSLDRFAHRQEKFDLELASAHHRIDVVEGKSVR